MAFSRMPGGLSFPYPTVPLASVGNIISTPYRSLLLDAATEIAAFSGRVWFTERTGTKDINTIVIGFGAVTPSTGSSTVRVSLQDPSTTAGAPMQPDGVVDQSWTATITNITANAVATVTLSANRTVTYGDLLSVVVDYSTFSGTPALNVRALSCQGNSSNAGTVALKAAGTWVPQGTSNLSILLGFTDGTWGCIYGGWAGVSWGTQAINTGSAVDEIANVFTCAAALEADGIWAWVGPTTGSSDFDLVLYSGAAASSVAVASCQVDANMAALSTGQNSMTVGAFATVVTLTAGTTYWIAVKPTTATSINVFHATMVTATQLNVITGGSGLCYASRADAGTWTTDTTQVALCGIMLCGVDTGAGGSGNSNTAGVFGTGVFG